jgi:hypothetical protein
LEFESRYNMNRINDGNQMGYDKMEERLSIAKEKINEKDLLSVDKDREEQAEWIKEGRDLAHETVFDKLLADYYLSKRDQYTKSKELIHQLD